jgi:hypothetical protein
VPATWRVTLDRGVGRRRLTALRRLAADVAGVPSIAARLLTEVVGRCHDVHGALTQTVTGLQATQLQYP